MEYCIPFVPSKKIGVCPRISIVAIGPPDLIPAVGVRQTDDYDPNRDILSCIKAMFIQWNYTSCVLTLNSMPD